MLMGDFENLLAKAESAQLDADEILILSRTEDTRSLMTVAAKLRDEGHQTNVYVIQYW